MKRIVEIVRRAFVEFLWLPALVVAAFLLLAALTTVMDHSPGGWLLPMRNALAVHLFGDSEATSDLLAAVAGSIITVTSITFSLLLLAVQQAASALTHEVYDQFLRRRVNQVYFGSFVGLAVFALIILASVSPPYNPVFGAATALLLTIISLMLLILLLYTTINQMRPVVVIQLIHDRVLAARERQRKWISTTRSAASLTDPVRAEVRSDKQYGYVVSIDFESLGSEARKTGRNVEVVLTVSIGTFVALHDLLAEIRADSPDAASRMAKLVEPCLRIEQQRDLDSDAAYGIEQLAIIAWTTVSTAKSNPSPGLLVMHSLRDVLARWSVGQKSAVDQETVSCSRPVVYTDDVFTRLLDAFETLAVVASESMQPQTMAEFVRTFAIMFDRLPEGRKPQAESLILRALSALGEHVLTTELDLSLTSLVGALDADGKHETARRVRTAQERLGASIGKLGSRATRVKANA